MPRPAPNGISPSAAAPAESLSATAPVRPSDMLQSPSDTPRCPSPVSLLFGCDEACQDRGGAAAKGNPGTMSNSEDRPNPYPPIRDAAMPASGPDRLGDETVHIKFSNRQNYLFLVGNSLIIALVISAVLRGGGRFLIAHPWVFGLASILILAWGTTSILSIISHARRKSRISELSITKDGIFSPCHNFLVPWKYFKYARKFSQSNLKQLHFHLKSEHYGELLQHQRRWNLGAVSFGSKAVVVNTSLLAIPRRDLYEIIQRLSGMEVR
jgi:hypothetical protein